MSDFPVFQFAVANPGPPWSTCSECGAVLGQMSQRAGEKHLTEHWNQSLAVFAAEMNSQCEAIIREAVRRAIEP